MLNRIELIGNLGGDPEMRTFDNGGKVVRFSVATHREWKDKNTGEKVKKTTWHQVEAWDRLAEVCMQFLKKGRQVRVYGRMEYDEFAGQGKYAVNGETIVDANGNPIQIIREKAKIVAREVNFLGSKPGSNTAYNNQAAAQTGVAAAPPAVQPTAQQVQAAFTGQPGQTVAPSFVMPQSSIPAGV